MAPCVFSDQLDSAVMEEQKSAGERKLKFVRTFISACTKKKNYPPISLLNSSFPLRQILGNLAQKRNLKNLALGKGPSRS
jgi:hypothetical protein